MVLRDDFYHSDKMINTYVNQKMQRYRLRGLGPAFQRRTAATTRVVGAHMEHRTRRDVLFVGARVHVCHLDHSRPGYFARCLFGHAHLMLVRFVALAVT